MGKKKQEIIYKGMGRHFVSKGKIDFKELLLPLEVDDLIKYTVMTKGEFDIYILPPIGKLKKYKQAIALFPLSFDVVLNNQPRIGFIERNVLYKGKLYEHMKFFGDNELINIDELIQHIKPDYYYKIPFTLTSVTAKEYNTIKTDLKFIRDFLLRSDLITNETGKLKSKTELALFRDEIIHRTARRQGKKISIEDIKEAVASAFAKKYPDEQSNKYVYPSDKNIRRIIRAMDKKTYTS